MTSSNDSTTTTLGATGRRVFRLGLSASYRPGARTVRRAIDEGINYLFAFGVDTHMNRVIRGMSAAERDRMVIATGGYNWLVWHPKLKTSLENALRRLQLDRIDVFHYLGVMKPADLSARVRDELAALREDPRVGAVAVSCHDRKLAGQLAANGDVDVLMIRYNAAHPGAEADIFPHVAARGTGVVGYTATRWSFLLRRPKGWPADQPIATPGQCYRFVLSNAAVHLVLTAPRSERELLENVAEVRRGPLPDDEMAFMRRFGAHVHERAGWFMGN